MLLNPASAGCFTDNFLLVLLVAACGLSVAAGSSTNAGVLFGPVLLYSYTWDAEVVTLYSASACV